MPLLSPDPAHGLDHAECRALLRDGSRTFHAACYLLPQRVRAPAAALYAFCRVADDAVDHAVDAATALAGLHLRLDAIYAGQPHPFAADRAFAAVVAHYGIPRDLPAALLEGFAWDVVRRRYEDLAALEAYGARVAGTVGAMMAVLMGATSREALARATDLGVAMQLSNIARDVGEDARAGRLYLPLAWLREEGIDPDQWLAQPVHTPALAAVVRRLLAAADRLYDRAASGVAALPADCRPAIHAARLLYAEIGHEVARRDADSVSQRAVVPVGRKVQLVGGALVASLRSPAVDAAPPLPATWFLVDAAARPLPGMTIARIPWWDVNARVIWSLDLFARLGERDALERAGGGD